MQALADFSIADLLIDRIGGWIPQIRKKIAEFLSGLQTMIRQSGDDSARVAHPAKLRWCIDERYRRAVASVS